jgi:hypothetical protein
MLPDEQKSKSAEQHVLILRVTDWNWLLAATYVHPKYSRVCTSEQRAELQNRL